MFKNSGRDGSPKEISFKISTKDNAKRKGSA
jgi:hypothetical protein